MKKKLLFAGTCLLLLFLLTNPGPALLAAKDGLSLWLNTLLPTLLPFLILTGLLLHIQLPVKIPGFCIRLCHILFGLSPWGMYAFLFGKLLGFPVGAKLAADLTYTGKISRQEGEYLLTFCSNPSPAFLLTYLGQTCLKGRYSASRLLLPLLLADLCCMLFFRFFVYKGQTAADQMQLYPGTITEKKTSQARSTGALLDVCIMNGFETITRLGGYILLFSVLSPCISQCPLIPDTIREILLCIMELTTGLHRITSLCLPEYTIYLASMTLSSFGGLCVAAQTKSVLDGRLPFFPYASAKCLSTILTLCILLLWI
nr:hypothetical protein [uncultured Blautia sp.]